MRSVCLLFVMLAVIGGPLTAEHTLSGVAIDSSGNTLSGLQVEMASGLSGIDPLFDASVLRTRTDEDGRFELKTDWDGDVSFHLITYSDKWFGELSEWTFRRTPAAGEVVVVCGVRHSALVRPALEVKALGADRRCLVVLRTGEFSVRSHLMTLSETDSLIFPVGESTVDVLCLASPISKAIPKPGELGARGWMKRGEARGAACADTIKIVMRDFGVDERQAPAPIRVRLPRLAGPIDLVGLDQAGAVLWHETPERFWRVHCGGSEVERLHELEGRFVTVCVFPGEAATHLMLWHRSESREFLLELDGLPLEDVHVPEWKPAGPSSFTVQIGADEAGQLRPVGKSGVELRLSSGPFFLIQVVEMSDKGIVTFELPSNFGQIDVQFPLGTASAFTEPNKLNVRRGVRANFAGSTLKRFRLTVRGPSGRSMASHVVPLRKLRDGKANVEFSIVLDASSLVTVYLEPGAKYEARIGSRWIPFVVTAEKGEVELKPWG